MINSINITTAHQLLKQGGVIAYPTETCLGLGCDPFNTTALARIIAIKGRQQDKGLLVLISGMDQLARLSQCLNQAEQAKLMQHWPGATTFVLPALPNLPSLLTGHRQTIAVRWSSHPLAQALCQTGPIVSTSANLSGQPPLYNNQELQTVFADQPQGQQIDGYVDGICGGQPPSTIIDLRSSQRLR